MKEVLIIGKSNGMGIAVAHELISLGWYVFIFDVTDEDN